MKIVGITWTNSAGKGTAVEFLIEKWFKHYSVRQFLTEEIETRGLEVNRDNMREVANGLRKEFGPAYIVEELFKKAEKEGWNAIIESIRCVGEVESLKKNQNFFLLWIDAEQKIRYERAILRGSETDKISREKFVEQESLEMNGTDPFTQNIKKCMEMADLVIENNGSLGEFREKVEGVCF